jgi:hypothetical protein
MPSRQPGPRISEVSSFLLDRLKNDIRQLLYKLWQQTQLGKDTVAPFLPVPALKKGGLAGFLMAVFISAPTLRLG